MEELKKRASHVRHIVRILFQTFIYKRQSSIICVDSHKKTKLNLSTLEIIRKQKRNKSVIQSFWCFCCCLTLLFSSCNKMKRERERERETGNTGNALWCMQYHGQSLKGWITFVLVFRWIVAASVVSRF